MSKSNKKSQEKSIISPKKGRSALSSSKINPYSFWWIFLIVFIVFLPSLSNGFVNWDDPNYILDNIYIKDLSWTGVKAMFTNYYAGNYHPLTALSNALEYKLFGLNPKPFHIVNLVIHLADTFLVFRLIKLLSSDIRIAVAVSLLFGIHPMHVESVAWISERKDVLYTFFYLTAIIKYIRFRESENAKQYIFMLAAFICALLSKSAAVSLPLTLLLVDYYFLNKINLRMLINKIPLFCLSLIFGIIAMNSQKYEGAINDLTPIFSLADRMFLVLYSIQFYLLKSIMPFGLTAFHAYPEKISNLLPWYYYSSPVIIGLIFFAVYKFKKFRRELIFGLVFFFINIVLMLQLLPVGQAIAAERYSYISFIGLFFIAANLFFYAEDNLKNSRSFIRFVGAVCILILGLVTFNRNKVWKDSISLWTDVINKNPSMPFAYYNLGNAHKNIKDFQGAVDAYSGAIKINSGHIQAIYNRAHAYSDMQNHQAAIDDYSKIIQLSPKFGEAYFDRAVSKSNLKDYNSAIEDFNASLPNISGSRKVEAYYNIGNMKAYNGLFEDAVHDYSLAIQLDSRYAVAYTNRGNCKLNLKRIPEACEDWKMSVQLGSSISLDMINKYCN